MKEKMKKVFKILLFLMIGIILFLSLMTLFINIYMINYAKKYIIEEEENNTYNYDCITVLGASVRADGTPSLMLRDRLDKGIDLYYKQLSKKILMSGDHMYFDYDEVNTMKRYAIEKDVPSSDIFMDHAGINTYDSMYRLKEIYGVKKTVIVTQNYHLYRSIYIARKLGIDAYGIEASPIEYSGQFHRDIREILARVKDFFKVMFKPKATIMGDAIEVSGNGDITNDIEKFTDK